MYNEERKRRYLDYKESLIDTPQETLRTRFKQSEPMEEKLDKDIAEFTAYELQDFYKSLNLAVADTLRVSDSLLSDYTDWCIKENLIPDGQNHHVEMTYEIIAGCVNKTRNEKRFITREQIEKYVTEGNQGRQLPNPADKFIMLALFEGIKGKDYEELFGLSMANFSGNTVTLPVSGKKFKVSDLLLKYAKESQDEYTYYPLSTTSDKISELSGGGIIKDYVNAFSTDAHYRGRRIYERIRRILRYLDLDKEISANTIYESGKIHFIKTCIDQSGMDIEDYLTANMKVIKEKYSEITYKSVVLRKYGEFLK